MRRFTLFVLAGIVAACGGDSGTNSPPPEPVTSVQITGTARVKVGDTYPFAVEARTADGTLVQRAVTWSVVETGKATVASNGAVTPLQTGTITIRATVEGVVASATLNSYDWVPLAATGIVGLGLDGDNPITNKFGTSEYASLLIGCVDGTFVVGVATDHFVTASGAVTYSFGNGAPQSATWLESDDFSSLTYPGLSNLAQKNFATQIAGTSLFRFTFTEFQAGAKQTDFRVTGLAGRLPQVVAACPSNAIRDAGTSASAPEPNLLLERLRAARDARG